MKEPDWDRCTAEELWKYIATRLSIAGIDTVLVGGAVVAIYTEGAYQSGDLDFVQLTYLSQKLPEIMRLIGFKKTGGRHFCHPKCKHLSIEFVSGPVGIGDDIKIVPATVKTKGATIKLFSPTDCIRYRLAS